MKSKTILIVFLICTFFESCSPPGWIKPLTESDKKQPEKKAISIAIFNVEGPGLFDEEKEQISNYLYFNLGKLKKLEILDRNQLNLQLLRNDFPLEITDNNTAIAAGKMLAVDKVMTSVCGKIGITWMISAKLIDVNIGVIDTTISYKGTNDDILKNTTVLIAERLEKEVSVPQIGKRVLWITMGGILALEVASLVFTKETKKSQEFELPRPIDFRKH